MRSDKNNADSRRTASKKAQKAASTQCTPKRRHVPSDSGESTKDISAETTPKSPRSRSRSRRTSTSDKYDLVQQAILAMQNDYPVEDNDSDYTPDFDSSACRKEGSSEQLCGQCDFVGSPSLLQQHIYGSHNGLARAAGESQEFNKTDERYAMRAVLKAGFSLNCHLCEKQYRSVTGFTSHMEICRDADQVQMVACEACGRMIRSESLPLHQENHKKQAKVSEGRSAESADVQKVPSNATVAAWRRALRRGRAVSCPYPGCDFSSPSATDNPDGNTAIDTSAWSANLDAMKRHYTECTSRPDLCRVLQCKLCKQCFSGRTRQHLMDVHMKSVHPSAAASSSAAEDVEQRLGNALGKASSAAATNGKHRSVLGDKITNSLVFFTHIERQPNTSRDVWYYRDWCDKMAATGNDSVDWMIPPEIGVDGSDWTLCTKQQRQHYSSSVKKSPLFSKRVLTVDEKTNEVAVPEVTSYQRLQLFSSRRLDSRSCGEPGAGVVSFCGGPVTALSWCPTDPSANNRSNCSSSASTSAKRSTGSSDKPDSVGDFLDLAVSCRQVNDSATTNSTANLSPLTVSHEPAVIQLWRLKCNAARQTVGDARLSCCLCIDTDCGPIWDLQWRIPVSSDNDADIAYSCSDRLGVLAAACGDGCVRVFVVPSVDSIREQCDNTPNSKVKPVHYICARPALLLCIYESSRCAPCVTAQWTRGEESGRIVAVFGDGSLAVWLVASLSPLLTDPPSAEHSATCRRVYPIRVMAAHHGQPSALAVSPFSGRFVFSGGRDRLHCVWDLEEPCVRLPRVAGRHRPPPMAACWPDGIKKVVLAHDHSLLSGAPSVTLLDTALAVGDQPLMTHVAKCGALAVNPVSSVIATGTDSGVLALAHWRKLAVQKQKADQRRLLMRVDILPSPQSNSSLENDGADGVSPPENDNQQCCTADTFSDALSSCAVVFSDVSRRFMSYQATRMDENLPLNGSWVTGYPFCGVNRLAWSDNCRRLPHLLAVGLECGLMRVIAVSPDLLNPS